MDGAIPALDVKDFFDNYRYFNNVRRFPHFRPLSHGIQGYSFLVYEIDEEGRPVRKLAIKYAKGTTWEESLQKEKDFVEKLRYAPHIVNPIDIDTTSLERVMLVMEYLPNGTLYQFMERVKIKQCRIPNLILWRIFLCLIRAVVGMAYPPSQPVPRETIPLDTVKPQGMAHGDLHMGNILVGDLDLSDSEHDLVPIIKVIDFGFAGEVWPRIGGEKAGMNSNIRDIGNNMARLIRTFSGDPWNVLSFLDDPEIDDELKTLIRACLNPFEDKRPDLHKLLGDCVAAVANRTADYYFENEDGGASEKPESLKHYLQDMLLDADDQSESSTASDEILRALIEKDQPKGSEQSSGSWVVLDDGDSWIDA